MKIKSVIMFLLCLSLLSLPCAVPAAAAGSGTSGTLDLMTYNVSGVPILGDTHSSQRKAIGGARMGKIGEVLTKENPDLVAVEEDFSFHDALAAAMSAFEYRSYPIAGLFGGDGLNVFSKYPVYNTVRTPWRVMYGVLSGACDRLAEKGILSFTMEPAPGVYIDFYVIHADCGHGVDYKSIDTRRDNFIQLREMIERNSADRAVIVAGDFNSQYDRGERDDLYGTFVAPTGLKDVWAELENGGNYIFKDRDTWTPDIPESLDKVMYRNGGGVAFAPVEISHYDITDENGETYSDHRATRAVLAFTADGASPAPAGLIKPEPVSKAQYFINEFKGFIRALTLALTHLYEIPYPYELYQKITGTRL